MSLGLVEMEIAACTESSTRCWRVFLIRSPLPLSGSPVFLPSPPTRERTVLHWRSLAGRLRRSFGRGQHGSARRRARPCARSHEVQQPGASSEPGTTGLVRTWPRGCPMPQPIARTRPPRILPERGGGRPASSSGRPPELWAHRSPCCPVPHVCSSLVVPDQNAG